MKPISFRLSDELHKKLEIEAEQADLSVSELIRRRAAGHPIIHRTDLKHVSELRRLGGLLKHIHNETGGVYAQETLDCLHEIKKTLRSIAHDRQKNT